MTIPEEEARAVERGRVFMLKLMDRTTPLRAGWVRKEAGRVLKHYPLIVDAQRNALRALLAALDSGDRERIDEAVARGRRAADL